MFAIYKVYDKHPSGLPEEQWPDWSYCDGVVCEKQLLMSVQSAGSARKWVEQFQRSTKNTVYYQEIP